MRQRMLQRWRAIHCDEQGLNTLQVVAILAVAAIILVVIRRFWYQVFNWAVVNFGDVSSDWARQE